MGTTSHGITPPPRRQPSPRTPFRAPKTKGHPGVTGGPSSRPRRGVGAAGYFMGALYLLMVAYQPALPSETNTPMISSVASISFSPPFDWFRFVWLRLSSRLWSPIACCYFLPASLAATDRAEADEDSDDDREFHLPPRWFGFLFLTSCSPLRASDGDTLKQSPCHLHGAGNRFR